jgi:putative component of membrane protein insertase Oxa1/YidC/SpoIIIJ protein YidD
MTAMKKSSVILSTVLYYRRVSKCEPFKGVLIFQVPELNFQDAELDIRTRELNFLFSGP